MPCKWWRLVRPEASLFPVLAKRSCEGPRMILPSSYQMAPGCSSRTWFRVKVAKESFGINFFHIFGRGIYCWNPFWRGMIFSSEETKNTTKKTTHAETMPFHCFPCQPNSARRFFTFWALSCAGFARGSTSRASCPKLEFFSGKMVGGMKTMIDNWLQDMILSDEKMDNMVHLHNTSNGGFSLHFFAWDPWVFSPLPKVWCGSTRRCGSLPWDHFSVFGNEPSYHSSPLCIAWFQSTSQAEHIVSTPRYCVGLEKHDQVPRVGWLWIYS